MFCIGSIISTVYECRAQGITQAKIVGSVLGSIDPKSSEISNEAASDIARGVKNPSVYVMDALGKLSDKDYGTISDTFRDNIVGLIKENERELVKSVLIMMISDEPEIRDDTVVELISNVKKADIADAGADLATFLAGVFLYAIKNTKNNVGGKVKAEVREYIEKARKEAVKKKNKSKTRVQKGDEGDKAALHHDKVKLDTNIEEQIEQEAVKFCIKYDKDKKFIPLCQIVNLTAPLRGHIREMYNEYNRCSWSVRNKILEMNDVKLITVTDREWWYEYLDKFKQDYKRYNLGEDGYLYAFGQYFPRLPEYGEEKIGMYFERVYPVNVRTAVMNLIKNYNHDIFGLVDEYIHYSFFAESKENIEPPMNLIWREQGLDRCEENKLVVLLALFICATCRAIPGKEQEDKGFFAYSGPGFRALETAEDLFYMTLLVLYETYS